ncbi:MAG TPA: CvpA family protein [Chitinophagaceae bacterium]
MFLDIIVVILLVLALWKGVRNGFILGIFSFLAFIIGLAAAMKLSAVAADYIGQNVSVSERWLPILAFAAVFLLVVLLVRLGAKALESVVELATLGWLNRLGGVVLFALIYLFIFSILLFYADRLELINPETRAASVSFPFLQPLGPWVIEGLGVVVPFFRDMFSELSAFFDGVGRKA